MAIVPLHPLPVPEWGRRTLVNLDAIAMMLARKGLTIEANAVDRSAALVREAIAEAQKFYAALEPQP